MNREALIATINQKLTQLSNKELKDILASLVVSNARIEIFPDIIIDTVYYHYDSDLQSYVYLFRVDWTIYDVYEMEGDIIINDYDKLYRLRRGVIDEKRQEYDNMSLLERSDWHNRELLIKNQLLPTTADTLYHHSRESQNIQKNKEILQQYLKEFKQVVQAQEDYMEPIYVATFGVSQYNDNTLIYVKDNVIKIVRYEDKIFTDILLKKSVTISKYKIYSIVQTNDLL